MGSITEIMKTQANDLFASCRETSVINTEEGNRVSIYNDQLATNEDIAMNFQKLCYAYPSMNKMTDKQQAGFLKVFAEAVEFSKLTKNQLHDSVMNCICNKHQFGELQISDVVGFDKKVKLYTWSWACDKEDMGFVRSNLKRTDCDPWQYWWCKAQDLEQVNRMAESQNK